MDKLTEKEEKNQNDQNEKKERGGFFKNLGSVFTEVKALAKKERAIAFDLILFAVGLLFSRCHLIFGAYPLAPAFIAALPVGVVSALIGAVVGSLTLGKRGVIFAIIAVITAFIRVIISGGEREREGVSVFSESLLLRMCAATVGGFISAVYEILLSGFVQSAVLFGVSMVLLPAGLTFLLSGLFSAGFSPSGLAFGKENMLSLKGRSEKERYNIIFFQISSLSMMFFITLSLAELSFLGISASYVFLSFSVLFIAKRFGSLRALCAGFVASLGVSGVYSVSFGLLGLAAGGLFGFGLEYALIGGGAAAVLWGAYSSGLMGLLSILPEYSIAAIIAYPMLKKISPESTSEENETEQRSARDMIGTMALLYQKGFSENLDSLESSLYMLSEVMKRSPWEGRAALDEREYREVVLTVAEEMCELCPGREYCRMENISPCKKNVDAIAKKLASGETIAREDINLDDEFCQYPEEMIAAIGKRIARVEEEKFRRLSPMDTELFELVSRLIGEARMQDEAERAVNPYASEKLTEALSDSGFGSGVGRVFGDRKLHLLISGEDKDGERISSPEMKREIEKRLSVRLSEAEYFRKGDMALMECDTLPMYSIEYASSGESAVGSERSGDSLRHFETKDGYFYSLISDGMGSGTEAAKCSSFVCDFLERMLDFSASYDTVMQLLNRTVKGRYGECSATVDLFSLDLFSGEAVFLKSGAAPSYVKREGSIFRIRSKTVPIGLLSTIDSEKIKAEIREGDYVIMLSDGISQSTEESAWLVELLGKKAPESVREYSALILNEAKKHCDRRDDMSVSVLRIARRG